MRCIDRVMRQEWSGIEEDQLVDEIRFESDLVRALLRDQHPDLADLGLAEVDGGWDNQMWRLGDELAVRLPRTERAPDLLGIEQKWLPELSEHLPLPTPTPVRVGKPSSRFPHTWTIARWVHGEPADRTPITRRESVAGLAEFLRALHRQAPANAPKNPDRGIPFADFAHNTDGWFDVIADYQGAERIREIFDEAAAAPAWAGPPLWLHGDLHPANVVVQDGTLSGIVDFGELCAGDPATDLSAAWILLPSAAAVGQFFDSYGEVDDPTVARARGWAVLRALGLIEIGSNGRLGLPGGKPTWEPAGYLTLDRVLTEIDG